MPGKRADLKHFFADNDLYLYTSNAFVYGVFKNQVIKEQVYEPDWATDDRTTYTMKVADLLAELAPEGMNPSIQSAPLGFKPKVTGDDVVETYTTNVLRVVAHLVELKKKTGKTVPLGLEPEPRCYLETTDETVAYFEKHLFSGRTAQRLAKATGLNEADAAQAMRDFTGVVFDIGHQSVGYEDIPTSLQKLVDHGDPDHEAAGSGVDVDARGDAEDGGRAAGVRQDGVSVADLPEEGRQDHLVPEPRGRVRGLPARTRARASGARTSTCRCSSTTSGRSARRGSRWSRRWRSTRRRRSRRTWRSRPTPGTCCPAT